MTERLGPVRAWMSRRVVRRSWPMSAMERGRRYARFERAVAWVLIGLLMAHLLDEPVWRWMTVADEKRLESRDWYQVLRQLGYLPVWIIVGVAYGLNDLRLRRRGVPNKGPRAVLIVVAPLLAGLIAELLKRVVGRERPPAVPVMTEQDPLPLAPSTEYVFKPFFGAWTDDANLGIPSSHTAVAFGALVLIGLMHRGVRPVVWGLAAGCGLSRVLAGAHWLSDVYMAAVIGAVSAAFVWAKMGRKWSSEPADLWAARGRRIA